MSERLKFRCPCCGMVSLLNRLDHDYEIEVFSETIGGKVPGENKGRGKAEGFIEYKNVTKSHPGIIKRVMEKVRSL